jgi:hypothetical protein
VVQQNKTKQHNNMAGRLTSGSASLRREISGAYSASNVEAVESQVAEMDLVSNWEECYASHFLRIANKVFADMCFEAYESVGVIINLHWQVFGNYSQLRSRTVGISGFMEKGKLKQYMSEFDKYSTWSDDDAAWFDQTREDFFSSFDGKKVPPLSQFNLDRIIEGLRIIYDAGVYINAVLPCGFDGKWWARCNTKFQVPSQDLMLSLSDSNTMAYIGWVYGHYGRVEFMHPVIFIATVFHDLYESSNYGVLRGYLQNMSKLYLVYNLMLEYVFFKDDENSIIFKFAKLQYGRRYGGVLGMQEVKRWYSSKVGVY